MSQETVFAILSLAIAVILHELAHGVVALALGDDTARRARRLTLNPISHIDRIGTVAVPLLLAIGQFATLGRVAFLYGWAKPVPVNPVNLHAGSWRNPRRLMALVAIAGPACNILLALLGGLLVHAAVAARSPDGITFLFIFIATNLVLGLFNLLPLPPMDGGRIAVGLLPLRPAQALARMEKAGIAFVLILLFMLPLALRQLGIVFDPYRAAMGWLLPRAIQLVLQLTGNGVGN